MIVEEDRTTRDYLYGRLLAIAERIEEVALSVGGENRPTTAARLMQRYADRPFSTWRNIELGLQPYMQRLQSSRAGFLANRKKELDNVMSLFQLANLTGICLSPASSCSATTAREWPSANINTEEIMQSIREINYESGK